MQSTETNLDKWEGEVLVVHKHPANEISSLVARFHLHIDLSLKNQLLGERQGSWTERVRRNLPLVDDTGHPRTIDPWHIQVNNNWTTGSLTCAFHILPDKDAYQRSWTWSSTYPWEGRVSCEIQTQQTAQNTHTHYVTWIPSPRKFFAPNFFVLNFCRREPANFSHSHCEQQFPLVLLGKLSALQKVPGHPQRRGTESKQPPTRGNSRWTSSSTVNMTPRGVGKICYMYYGQRLDRFSRRMFTKFFWRDVYRWLGERGAKCRQFCPLQVHSAMYTSFWSIRLTLCTVFPWLGTTVTKHLLSTVPRLQFEGWLLIFHQGCTIADHFIPNDQHV